MNINIKEIEEIKVVGFKIRANIKTTAKELPPFWEKLRSEKKLETIPNRKNCTEFGVCSSECDKDGNFDYIVGVEVKEIGELTSEMDKVIIPEGKYAIFTDNLNNITKTWNYIYEEWFPNNKEYKRSATPDFELYDERCGKNGDMDVYVPISPK